MQKSEGTLKISRVTFTKLSYSIIVLFLLLQTFTFIIWKAYVNQNIARSQNQFENQTAAFSTSLDSRINTYTNALRGFLGFFEGSEFVSEGEFHNYYQTLNLAENYLGFRSI